MYKKEPVLETMTYFGRLKGLDKAAARSWSLEYLERVGLAEKATARLDKLSGGQQQKVQLGVTIMITPELLILDEPTKGFDPVNRRLLMDIIEDQQKAGATVVMVTHQMEEAERLCDRVILLKDGTSHAYGTVREVQEQFGSTTYRVNHTGVVPLSHPLHGGEQRSRGGGAGVRARPGFRGRRDHGAGRVGGCRGAGVRIQHPAHVAGGDLHPGLRRRRGHRNRDGGGGA